MDLADHVWGTELIFYCQHPVNLLSLENVVNKCSIYTVYYKNRNNLSFTTFRWQTGLQKQRHYLRFRSPKNMWGLSLSRLLPFRYRLRRLVRLEKAPSWRYEMRLLPR